MSYELQPEKNEQHVVFKVQDTGIGVKDNELNKLFKLFGKLKLKNGMN